MVDLQITLSTLIAWGEKAALAQYPTSVGVKANGVHVLAAHDGRASAEMVAYREFGLRAGLPDPVLAAIERVNRRRQEAQRQEGGRRG